MKPSRRLATLGSLLALMALAGCVWDRGMHQRGRDDDRRDTRGQVPNSYQRDRDGRPCNEERSGEGGEHNDQHEQDCHRGRH